MASTGFVINDGGLFERLGVAPNIVAYFCAKALGSMFGRLRKEAMSRAASKGYKELIHRSVFYKGYPIGGEEHSLLKFSDITVIQRIHQKLFTTSEVTAAHELGARITPKNAQYLLIPAKGLGISRSGKALAKQIENLGPTPDTFIRKSRGGAAFLFRRQGDQIQLLALLKKSVDLPAKLGLMSTWRSLGADRQAKVDFAKEQIAKALGGDRTIDAVANSLLAQAYQRARRKVEQQASKQIDLVLNYGAPVALIT